MKVNILLSTYNGEKYLSEQIESIQAQTFTDWQLLIRDDGSRDGTVDLIKHFVKSDHRILFINEDNIVNYGVVKSFYHLVKFEKADYYFFSDQDDVWLPQKMAQTLEKAMEFPKQTPLMIYTDLSVVNEQLDIINNRMIQSKGNSPVTEVRELLCHNSATGGTSMVNHALTSVWHEHSDIIMHDWYLALAASALGKLVFLEEVTELYRQHDNNVLGASIDSDSLSSKIYHLSNRMLEYDKKLVDYIKQATCFYSDNERLLTEVDRECIDCFCRLPHMTIWQRVKAIKKFGYKKNNLLTTLMLRLAILRIDSIKKEDTHEG
ncbi:glycosyltransferase family 2 protein [Streptococcus hyovaginalis]